MIYFIILIILLLYIKKVSIEIFSFKSWLNWLIMNFIIINSKKKMIIKYYSHIQVNHEIQWKNKVIDFNESFEEYSICELKLIEIEMNAMKHVESCLDTQTEQSEKQSWSVYEFEEQTRMKTIELLKNECIYWYWRRYRCCLWKNSIYWSESPEFWCDNLDWKTFEHCSWIRL